MCVFVTSPPGVRPQLVKREGTGAEPPMMGDKVFVHYVGSLLDGTQFDSSRDRGEKFSFELGKGGFEVWACVGRSIIIGTLQIVHKEMIMWNRDNKLMSFKRIQLQI